MAEATTWTDTDTEVRKRGEQTGLDTLVVHAVNGGYSRVAGGKGGETDGYWITGYDAGAKRGAFTGYCGAGGLRGRCDMSMTESQAAILTRMLCEDFYFSPYKFAIWAYAWGEGDLRSFDGPRKWQREVMEDIESYLRSEIHNKRSGKDIGDFYRHAVASGRGPGKSALVGMLAHLLS